jgi:hypothetical protein
MRQMIEPVRYLRMDREPRDNGPRRGGGLSVHPQVEIFAQTWESVSSPIACIVFICGPSCDYSKRS